MKVRYIVICIIAGITLSLVIACNQDPGIGGGGRGGDDQPILVVGGSLHVSASSGKWDKQPDGSVVHKDTAGNPSKRHVTRIEVFSTKLLDGSTIVDKVDPVGPVSIEMIFGPSNPSSVSLNNDPSPAGLGLILGPGGAVDQLDSRLVSFTTGTPILNLVKINGKSYDCGPCGKCTLLIHYCDKQNGCK